VGTLGSGDVIGGTGALTFNRSGSYTIANNIAVNQLNLSLGLMTTTGTISAGGTLNVSGTTSAQWSVGGGSLTVTGLATVNAPGAFILNSGSAAFNGGIRTSNADSGVIRVNGGTFSATDVTIQRNRASG